VSDNTFTYYMKTNKTPETWYINIYIF
jgi:hypothetical protein